MSGQHEVARWVFGTLVPKAEAAFEGSVEHLDRSARLARAVAMGREALDARLDAICEPFKEHLHEQT
jgi:hypothetical protein